MGKIKTPSKPIIFHMEAHSPCVFLESFPHDIRSLKRRQEKVGKHPALGAICECPEGTLGSWLPDGITTGGSFDNSGPKEPAPSRWAFRADVAAMGRLDRVLEVS